MGGPEGRTAVTHPADPVADDEAEARAYLELLRAPSRASLQLLLSEDA